MRYAARQMLPLLRFLLTFLIIGSVSLPVAAEEGRRGMVVSAHRDASAIGQRILEAGGNAVDAAVAVGYALAVVDPCCGNLGGGGFMLIRLADARTILIDFRETAPRAATRDMFPTPPGMRRATRASTATAPPACLARSRGSITP